MVTNDDHFCFNTLHSKLYIHVYNNVIFEQNMFIRAFQYV